MLLDKFSVLKSPFQGHELHRLVARESGWLKEAYPGTVQRYCDWPHATKNVARVAINGGMEAYILREKQNDLAIGIATIVFNQTVICPDKRTFHGHDIDYWLSEGMSQNDHVDAAFALIRKARWPNVSQRGAGKGLPDLIATMQLDVPNPSIGLDKAMKAVGEPVALAMSGGEDPYGISREGARVQLYVNTAEIYNT